jgi:nitrite reductase/ring-hydroxylating ferredoxin subunit
MDDTKRPDFTERRRQIAREIQRRLVAHIAAGGTTDFALTPFENDPAVYTDPVQAELEKRELFLKLPLLAGLSREIPRPGDCLLFEEVGQSIIITRDEEGVLRAFLNMCTHRASKLIRPKPDGTCHPRKRLTCPFHAWSFDLRGNLVAVPGSEGFEGIDRMKRGLLPVPVAEWNGLIFLRAASGNEKLNIQEHLGLFAPELAQLELADATPINSSKLTADSNWKFALDTFGEGYHFAVLHASTIGLSHYSNIAVFDTFGPHWRMNFPERGLKALVEQSECEWPKPDYGGIHFLFPNVILVVGYSGSTKGFLRIFRLFPGPDPGKMSCRIAAYALGATSPDEYRHGPQSAKNDAESDITREDYQIAVDGYANLVNAPAGFKVVYGRNEPGLQALHRSIANAINRPSKSNLQF